MHPVSSQPKYRRASVDEVFTRPTAQNIRQAIAEFDADNRIIEDALRELLRQYPYNSSHSQVLLKATAINTLYSTQIRLYSETIPTILDIAEHITNLAIDSDLERGDDSVVSQIATVQMPSKKPRFYYSFATKYCSWHNPNSYPIFDNRVYTYLCHLVNEHCLDHFIQNDCWVYPKFKKIIEEFRERNRLGEFTFKDIDKFLYLQGSLLFSRKQNKQTEPIVTETILVPVPGQPGEMEWSIENYSTLEEAEESQKKWTDSGGLRVIKRFSSDTADY